MYQRYRADIDGLRSVAILPVIFFHLGVGAFAGGYVGVDVFFVISGYLITGVIVREISVNGFSLAKFYERRIRRIYPALFTMVVFTIISTAWLYDADNFLDFGKSMVATAFFFSNMLFWNGTGYFDGPTELKPLLHTWSLAVEEQFYIFFPLLVILVFRFNKSKLPQVLISIAITSFVLSIYSVNQNPINAFYLAPMRIWEMLMGSILALNIFPMCVNQSLKNGLGLLGMGLIFASVLIYSKNTLFPGLAALPPTLGAALIIYVGMDGNSWTKNVLSLNPIVFIGKISYSLYLWHWPLIVFSRYYLISPLTIAQIFVVLLLTFGLSVLSWYFVERPFRAKAFMIQKQIFYFAAITMMAMAIVGATIYLNDGFPNRYDANKFPSFIGTKDEEWNRWSNCGRKGTTLPIQLSLCPIGSDSTQYKFLVWGDSHAKAMATAIDSSAKEQGVAGNFAQQASCPPLLGIGIQGARRRCRLYNDALINYIEQHPELDTIILSARWAIYANGTQYKTENRLDTVLIDLMEENKNTMGDAELFSLGLHRTIAKLAEMNRNIVIVSQVPEIGYNVPTAYFMAERIGKNTNEIIAPSISEYFNRNQIEIETFEKLIAEYPGIQIIDPWKALCNDQMCFAIQAGKPLYRDDDHLSTFGSHYISYLFTSLFEKIALTNGK